MLQLKPHGNGSGHFTTQNSRTNTVPTTTEDSSSAKATSQRSLGWGGGTSLETTLHYGKLEELLVTRIPRYFKKIKSSQFIGLSEMKSRRRLDMLKPAICYLEDALAAPESKAFPFDVLVDVHSSLGIMYDMEGDVQTAIDYYMSALWLLHKAFKSGGTATKGYDLNHQVAVNLCRLGNSYGKLGDQERMQEAYDRSEWFREGDIFIATLKP